MAYEAMLSLLLLVLQSVRCTAGGNLVVVTAGMEGTDHGALRAAKAAGVATRGFYAERKPQDSEFKQWVMDLYKLQKKDSVEAKDLANAAEADFTLALRPDASDKGVGSAKNLNMAVFGFRQAADEHDPSKKAKGPLHIQNTDSPTEQKQFVAKRIAYFKKGEEYESLPESTVPLDDNATFDEKVKAKKSGMVFQLIMSSNDTVDEDVLYKVGAEVDLAITPDKVWEAFPKQLSDLGDLLLNEDLNFTQKDGTPEWPKKGCVVVSENGAQSIEVTDVNEQEKTFEYKLGTQVEKKTEEQSSDTTIKSTVVFRYLPHEGNPKSTTLRWEFDFKELDDKSKEQALKDLERFIVDPLKRYLDSMMKDVFSQQREQESKLPGDEQETPRPIVGYSFPEWYMPELPMDQASKWVEDGICFDYNNNMKPDFVIYVTGSLEGGSPGMAYTTETLLTNALKAVKGGACGGPPAGSNSGTVVVIVVVAIVVVVAAGFGIYKFMGAGSTNEPLIGSNVEMGTS